MEQRLLKLVSTYMRGDDVKEMQTLLNKQGFSVDADGVFGPKTETSVKAFQKAKGLTVDGKVGGKTWAALRNEPAQPTQSKDRAQLAADFTAWLRMCVGDHYIYGAQGHELTKDYLSKRYNAHPEHLDGGRYEWVRAEIDRAAALGKKLYCEDCSGLFFKVNEMMRVIPESDMSANGLWTSYCTSISLNDVQPLDILFRQSSGKMTHMAVLGTDGVYEAAGAAYGVVFRPWADRLSRKTYNRMTGQYDTKTAWTHAGRLKIK